MYLFDWISYKGIKHPTDTPTNEDPSNILIVLYSQT